MNNVPFYFREAVVFDVDPINLTCSLHYGDPGTGQISRNVPLPNILGSGNVGLIVNLLPGTRVIAAYLHDTAKDPIAIFAVLPSEAQKGPLSIRRLEFDRTKNPGTIPYPTNIALGEIFLSSHINSHLHLRNDNSFILSSKNQKGLFLISGIDDTTQSLYSAANNHNTEGSGGKLSWGRIKRNMANIGYSSIHDFYLDIDREKKLDDVCLWPKSPPASETTELSFRNPVLSEYRLVINEFSTEFGFSGFDKEFEKLGNSKLSERRDPTYLRDSLLKLLAATWLILMVLP